MPVTIYPADHPAKAWRFGGETTSSLNLFKRACPNEHEKSQRIIQTSFDEIPGNGIYPDANGFVTAVWEAYNDHHHLQIRPEDIWFSILTQLNFYINKNAEELRSHFVAHEGKKEVTVRIEGTLDCGELAIKMTKQMEEHIVDPKLREWIMPDFTTTEATDKVTAAILMMGSMQNYFSYVGCISCGLPSVTLLGTKDDWRKIRNRIDKIYQFGKEAKLFAKLLRPVLDHLVRSFDDPEDPDILDFWGKIVHYQKNGSGPSYLSGWITAFCFWAHEGTCLHTKGLDKGIYNGQTKQYHAGCKIDGVQFHYINGGDVPEGFVSVPVKLIDNGVEAMTRMVAGSVGVKRLRFQKATTTPRVETPEETEQIEKKKEQKETEEMKETEKTEKKANKIARLREFILRLTCFPGRDAGGSTSKESPDKAAAVEEPQVIAVEESQVTAVEEPAQESYTPSKPRAPEKKQKAILDSVQPVSGWWMYELKAGEE
ncbi:hypothetical protein CEP52_002138 [Fusarium oligoseptatum]|uniref:DUF4419 domain-containing protein n=1 Tax=Fusarium oligoseptatum TaxID=2604345 RepID=A0A428UFN9_9HYPO|nr:hypothetical protein CEP52_002138 [Fusarium oligoseptatum]